MRATLSLASKFHPAISLRGRHCLITGGSGALGSAIATDMARAGARVTLLGRDELKLKGALAQLQSAAPPSLESETKAETVEEEDIRHRYLVIGEGREVKDLIAAERKIDVLVNAAGVPQSSLLVRTSDDEIERILGSNLTLTIAACKAATRPLMRAAPDSCIINMASLLGTHGGRGSSVYAASKAGIIGKQKPPHLSQLPFTRAGGLTRSLAAELGPLGIRVNCLVPGYIQAGMIKLQNIPVKPEQIPLRRYGHESEVAHAAMFLATNRYANNCVLNIDGGLSAGLV